MLCRKNPNTVLCTKHVSVTLNIYDFEVRNSEAKPGKSNLTGNMTSGRYVGLGKCRIIREKPQYRTLHEKRFGNFEMRNSDMKPSKSNLTGEYD